jgi:hypothetical protein
LMRSASVTGMNVSEGKNWLPICVDNTSALLCCMPVQSHLTCLEKTFSLHYNGKWAVEGLMVVLLYKRNL